MWTSMVFPNHYVLWHDKQCLLGDCCNCGVDSFKICLEAVQFDKLVSWKSIGYEVVGFINEGKEKKASKLEYKETLAHDFIQYMKPRLKEFVLHNYITRWQDSRFRKVLSNVSDDMVIFCINFSENYIMKIQNEI
jgi:hypothetical protein